MCVDDFRYMAYTTPGTGSAHITENVITTPVLPPRAKEPTEYYVPAPVGQFRSSVPLSCRNACVFFLLIGPIWNLDFYVL